jgi:hypothetical protein
MFCGDGLKERDHLEWRFNIKIKEIEQESMECSNVAQDRDSWRAFITQ